MTRLSIPSGATMKYKKGGRWVYAVKKTPIVWTSKQPPAGTELYVVGWYDGQGPLMASKVEVQK